MSKKSVDNIVNMYPFVIFTIYGILHLVLVIPWLINYENYEKELINIKELDSYGTKKNYILNDSHKIPKSENEIKVTTKYVLVTKICIIITIICYCLYLVSLLKLNNNKRYKKYMGLFLFFIILITLVLSMINHSTLFNKYSYEHKTNNNFYFYYDDFKEKQNRKQGTNNKIISRGTILSLNVGFIIIWILTLVLSFAGLIKK